MNHSKHPPSQRNLHGGFSLVELSIVLVILGLLVGGILAGKSLIRASELRSVGDQYASYAASVHAFRDRYFGLPGDIRNATNFWGAADNNDGNGVDCYGITAAAPSTATCNGNADNIITPGQNETFRSWQQLANAGLVEGTLSGVSGPLNGNHHIPGTNCPMGKIATTGWTLQTLDHPGDGSHYKFDYGTSLIFGGALDTITQEAVLTPGEAWNIDRKYDDGKPGSGKVFAMPTGVGGFNNVNSCTTSTSFSDYAGDYRQNIDGIRCALIFRMN